MLFPTSNDFDRSIAHSALRRNLRTFTVHDDIFSSQLKIPPLVQRHGNGRQSTKAPPIADTWLYERRQRRSQTAALVSHSRALSRSREMFLSNQLRWMIAAGVRARGKTKKISTKTLTVSVPKQRREVYYLKQREKPKEGKKNDNHIF